MMRRLVLLLMFVAFLSCGTQALEGSWDAKLTRVGFVAGEINYHYSFDRSGEGVAEIVSAETYGNSKLQKIDPGQFKFHFQFLELLGTKYLVIFPESTQEGQETDPEWYEIMEATENRINTTCRGASVIFTRQ